MTDHIPDAGKMVDLDAEVARLMGWSDSHEPGGGTWGGTVHMWRRGDTTRNGCPPYASAAPGSNEAAILAMEMIAWLRERCRLEIGFTDEVRVGIFVRSPLGTFMDEDSDEFYRDTLNVALARALVAAEAKRTEAKDATVQEMDE